ncbi:hypothetical protein [Bosea sp. (in: a-proteobacteria)]|uniref:hypothetical protein n=1 Tax=Bosea sp. (in: a-proteobacteria) TaxID=1871050 RepID=UPI00261242A5|nr:hypothetical protein [Bosea sp. (in: a-proteobacteria)]MCO5091980.1 hypothetical protein [Bosea sp. (in: a-proteobacteria)]
MQVGKKAARAQFRDAQAEIRRAALADPAPEELRDGVFPGTWQGFPVETMPPGCPVIPLGVDGKTCYLVDTLGQMITVSTSEWNKKTLAALFSLTPNFLYWAWPRWGGSKKGEDGERLPKINGFDADAASACLMKACGERGLFDPGDKVRGRGGWVDSRGRFIWHSGEALYTVEAGRLKEAPPGDVDGVFYARRPPVIVPWQEAIEDAESPAHDILKALKSWAWERPVLDAVLALGWIAASMLGAGLHWRPTLFVTGDRGHGKSTLQNLVKDILGPVLHASADTTAAGIYQRVKQDSLPVGVDELEADADNRKVMAVVKLARLAASGAEMFRGGAEHEGVTFRARNAFFFSSINPPPLAPQDRSRIAQLNMRKRAKTGGSDHRLANPQAIGRQLLRRMMDRWVDFEKTFANWQDTLSGAGFDGRGCDTYGVLLACAELALGSVGLEEAGLPLTEVEALGQMLASATAAERAEQTDNWRDCLERVLSWTVDNYRSGERPIVGETLDQILRNDGTRSIEDGRAILMQAGLSVQRPDPGRPNIYLAIPPRGTQVEKIFAGTVWQGGVWMHALKQGPDHIVRRGSENNFVVKIAGVSRRCVLIDMAEFSKHCEGG